MTRVRPNSTDRSLLCRILTETAETNLIKPLRWQDTFLTIWSYNVVIVSVLGIIFNLILLVISALYMRTKRSDWKNYVVVANIAASNTVSAVGLIVTSIMQIIAYATDRWCYPDSAFRLTQMVAISLAVYVPGAAQITMGLFHYLALRKPMYYQQRVTIKFKCLVITASWVLLAIWLIVDIILTECCWSIAKYFQPLPPSLSIIGSTITLVCIIQTLYCKKLDLKSNRPVRVSKFAKQVVIYTPIYILICTVWLSLQISTTECFSAVAKVTYKSLPEVITNSTVTAWLHRNRSKLSSHWWHCQLLFLAEHVMLLVWVLRTVVEPIGILCGDSTLLGFFKQILPCRFVSNQMNPQSSRSSRSTVSARDYQCDKTETNPRRDTTDSPTAESSRTLETTDI